MSKTAATSERAERHLLPLSHLSIRVPWHDAGWAGRVCTDPKANSSCLVLRRIREQRNDEAQAAVASRRWDQLTPAQLPPCIAEHGGFMSSDDLVRSVTHPYFGKSDAHAAFAPTPLRYPAYSAACIPYRWMLRKGGTQRAEEHELPFKQELEDQASELMKFKANWLQDEHNQRLLLETFFSAVRPQQSLCFFYAKRTPLSEDPRRVLIGVGRITGVGDTIPYQYSGTTGLRSVLWERAVTHSIRPDYADGFLLPYRELLEKKVADPDLDLEPFVAFAPEDHWLAFSYGTEHVSNDAAIAVLLECDRAVRKIAPAVAGPWDDVTRWISDQLGSVWKLRGAYPGLGACLVAFGVEHGILLAYLLGAQLKGELADPWPLSARPVRDASLCGSATAVPAPRPV